jgi:tetratricopeptide (TPR) repeat protein
MIRALALFLFISCFVGIKVWAQSPGHVHYKSGEALLKQNKATEALEKFNLALVEEPSNFLYHSGKGQALMKQEKYDLALSSFQKAIYYKEDYARGYEWIGEVYVFQNQLDKAINYYNLAYKTEQEISSKVIFKCNLIKVLIDNDRLEQAELHLNDVLTLAPYNSDVHYWSGELNFANGNLSAAIRGYKKALEYNKEVKPEVAARIYYGLGKALYQNGDTENAKKAWTKANYGEYKKLVAEDMSRLNPEYFYKAGVSYYLTGDLDEAMLNLKKAVEMKADYSQAFKYLGMISDKRDLTTEANSYFTKATQTEKDSAKLADIFLIWLGSQIENENFAGAITSAERVLRYNNQNAKAWLYKCQAEFHLSRYSAAMISAEKGLASIVNLQDPVKKAPYYFYLGVSARFAGNISKAKEALALAQHGNTKYAAKHELDILNGVISR